MHMFVIYAERVVVRGISSVIGVSWVGSTKHQSIETTKNASFFLNRNWAKRYTARPVSVALTLVLS